MNVTDDDDDEIEKRLYYYDGYAIVCAYEYAK